MSMANVTTGRTGPEQPAPPWQPALTQKEAARIEISKDEYEQAFLYARVTAEEHQTLRTPATVGSPRSA
jgi:hypothetical protein